MIRLQFVLGPDVSSKAIAWFSASHFSHVDIVLEDGCLLGARSDAVGGQPPGVRIRPPDYAQWRERVVLEIKAGTYQQCAFKRFAFNQIGKPYDKTAIWGFALGRNWRDTDKWFCSELAGAALEAGAVLPVLFTPSNKLTPGGLALAVSAAGGYVT